MYVGSMDVRVGVLFLCAVLMENQRGFPGLRGAGSRSSSVRIDREARSIAFPLRVIAVV